MPAYWMGSTDKEDPSLLLLFTAPLTLEGIWLPEEDAWKDPGFYGATHGYYK
jgi:hypothetical protein